MGQARHPSCIDWSRFRCFVIVTTPTHANYAVFQCKIGFLNHTKRNFLYLKKISKSKSQEKRYSASIHNSAS